MTADTADNIDAVVLLHVRWAESKSDLNSRRLIFRTSTNTWDVGRTNGLRKPLVDNAVFASPVVSRSHARFSFNKESKLLYLMDLGSLHGTWYLNDESLGWYKLEPYREKVIAEGAQIRFGKAVNKPGEKNEPVNIRVTFGTVHRPATMPVQPIKESIDKKDDANGQTSVTAQKMSTTPMQASKGSIDKKDDAILKDTTSATSPPDQGKSGCYGIPDDKVLYPSDAESDDEDDVALARKLAIEAPEVIETKTVLYVPDSLPKAEAIVIDPIDKAAELVKTSDAIACDRIVQVAGSVKTSDAIAIEPSDMVAESVETSVVIKPVHSSAILPGNLPVTTSTSEALKASNVPNVGTGCEQSPQDDTKSVDKDSQKPDVVKDVEAPSAAEIGEPEDELMDEDIHDPEWVFDMEPDVESSDEEDPSEPQQDESDSDTISESELREVKVLASSRAYGLVRHHQAYAHDEIVSKTMRIRELEGNLCNVQSKLSEVQRQAESLQVQLAEKDAIFGAEAALHCKADQLAKESQIKVTDLELELSKTKEELDSVKRCHTARTEELTDLESIFDSEMTNLRTAEAEIKSLKTQLKEKAAELKVMQEKYDEMIEANEEGQADVFELNEKIDDLIDECAAKDKLLHHFETLHSTPKDVKVQSSDESKDPAANKASLAKEIDHLYQDNSAYEDGYEEGYIQGMRAQEDDDDSDICSDCDDDCPKVACRISRSWDDGYVTGRQDGAMDADADAAYEQGYEDALESVGECPEWHAKPPAQLITPAASPSSAKKGPNIMESEGPKSSDSEEEIATTSISPFKVLSPIVLKRKRDENASEQASIQRPVKRTRKVLTIVAHAAIGALAGSIGTIAGLAALGGGQE